MITPDDLRAALPAHIFNKIDFSTEHWKWTGRKATNGYGQTSLKGKSRIAHRLIWTLVIGPVPRELHVHHECRIRDCVNLNHLRPVTPKENSAHTTQTDQTCCIHGHEYTPENTLWHGGRRECATCVREARHRRYWADPERWRARGRAQYARNPEPYRRRVAERRRRLAEAARRDASGPTDRTEVA